MKKYALGSGNTGKKIKLTQVLNFKHTNEIFDFISSYLQICVGNSSLYK